MIVSLLIKSLNIFKRNTILLFKPKYYLIINFKLNLINNYSKKNKPKVVLQTIDRENYSCF